MSTKNTQSLDSCYNRADGDEPMFVLLGRDPCAAFTVLFWSKMRLLIEGPSDQISEAQTCAEQLRDWAIKLGKEEKLTLSYDAFRAACFEVAKKEIENHAGELQKLLQLYGIKCDRPEVKERVDTLVKKLAGVE